MKPISKTSRVTTAILAAGAATFIVGCETAEIQAIVAGVELVADTLVELDGDSRNDDGINFGDWLLDELRR